MFKKVSNWNFDEKDEILDYVIIATKLTILVCIISAIALVLNGCEQPKQKAQLQVKEVCENNYVYRVYGKSRKEIVIENGEFKICESGEISF